MNITQHSDQLQEIHKIIKNCLKILKNFKKLQGDEKSWRKILKSINDLKGLQRSHQKLEGIKSFNQKNNCGAQ